MRNFFSAYWWVFLLRGIFALIFGVLCLVWPVASFTTLIIFLGAYLLMSGLFGIISAIGARKTNENWGLLLLTGIVGLIAGAIALYNPFITGAAVVYIIACWAMVAGVLEIIMAIRLRNVIVGEGWYIVGGLLTVIFGILLAANPLAAALTLTWLFGGYAIFSGIMLISLAFRIRKRGKYMGRYTA
jgi:uncharacterized membrane protein HdeD (DUF308 family)